MEKDELDDNQYIGGNEGGPQPEGMGEMSGGIPDSGPSPDGEDIEDDELDEPDEDGDSNEDKGPIEDRSPEENATTLLKQAIKHLDDDNKKTAINYIKLAVKHLTGKAEVKPADKNDPDAELYGECRNFGVVYHILESNSASLYKTQQGRKVIKEAIQLIKGNKVLSEQFNYYSLYVDKHNTYGDVNEYVNEAVTTAPQFTKTTLLKENQKLIDVLRKGNVNEMIMIDDDTMSLYEAVESTLIAKNAKKRINEMVSAKAAIKSVLKKKSKMNEAKKVTYKQYEKAVSSTAKEISEGLTDDEFKLIKEMSDPNCDKKSRFSFYKQDTLKSISRAMNEETNNEKKARLSKIYVHINEQQYNEDTTLLDVAKFIDVKNVLS